MADLIQPASEPSPERPRVPSPHFTPRPPGPLSRFLLRNSATGHGERTYPWWQVLWLTGMDYFSTGLPAGHRLPGREGPLAAGHCDPGGGHPRRRAADLSLGGQVFLALTLENKMDQAFKYLLLGEGEIGVLVYEILVRYWESTPEDDVRPLIFLMSD
jgi:hypothetical protein